MAGMFAFSSCGSNSSKEEAENEATPAIDFTAMDKDISPREDFYRYVNGGWMKANPLKDEYGRYGTFDMLRDSALSTTHQIILDMKDAPAGSEEAKAYELYQLVMDMDARNSQGAKPIMNDLESILALQSKEDLVPWLAEQAEVGSFYFFAPYVGADEQNSSQNIMSVYQGGLIMGDQSYYADKKELKPIQDAYFNYTTKLLNLVGYDGDSEAVAKNAYKVEKELSEIMMSRLERRNVEANYNKLSLEEVSKTLKFPWTQYFSLRNGMEGIKEVNMAQLAYFKKLDNWLDKTPMEEIQSYLAVSLIDGAARYLSQDFVDASFDFHGRTIGGLKEDRPLWKKAVAIVNSSLGDAVGQKYVATYFPPEAKDKMTKIVENLQVALGERINSLDWMSEETKVKAQDKLATFHVKIGYPEVDEWVKYDNLKMDNSSLYAMMKQVGSFEIARNTADLGKPVDPNRWFMNAHEVNAYYNPSTNEICFPAGILQPPFFNLNADDAVNYGGIGVVIGHEMTHGFDDQGRKYDKVGNMTDWWTEEDAKLFNEKAQILIDQYSKIQLMDDLMADGALTIGENIADQGGLLIAYNAMKNATNNSTEKIDDLTPDQRFFIAYGRLWGQNVRPEEVRRLTKVDVHSLGELRVNQAVRNIPAFYEAFGVVEGDKMYLAPEERVLVW